MFPIHILDLQKIENTVYPVGLFSPLFGIGHWWPTRFASKKIHLESAKATNFDSCLAWFRTNCWNCATKTMGIYFCSNIEQFLLIFVQNDFLKFETYCRSFHFGLNFLDVFFLIRQEISVFLCCQNEKHNIYVDNKTWDRANEGSAGTNRSIFCATFFLEPTLQLDHNV